MNLDVRVPLGAMFFLIGLVLTLYGLSGVEGGGRPGEVNVNARTGLTLLLFGSACLALAWRARRKNR